MYIDLKKPKNFCGKYEHSDIYKRQQWTLPMDQVELNMHVCYFSYSFNLSRVSLCLCFLCGNPEI